MEIIDQMSLKIPFFILFKAMSSETEPSLLGKSVLQSTFSDGHCFRPDFDISVIKGKLKITFKKIKHFF